MSEAYVYDYELFIQSCNQYDEGELLADLNNQFLNQTEHVIDHGWNPKTTPFSEPLVLRGSIATFRNHFVGDQVDAVDVARDFQFIFQLQKLNLDECYYGAGSYPIFGILCDTPSLSGPANAKSILDSLPIREFKSEHIENLETTNIPYPGYHPSTRNDEIHTEYQEQNLFPCEEWADENWWVHGILKKYVLEERVWYILLHDWDWLPTRKGPEVTLLTVGQSPLGNRLVGMVSHQMRRNLSD